MVLTPRWAVPGRRPCGVRRVDHGLWFMLRGGVRSGQRGSPLDGPGQLGRCTRAHPNPGDRRTPP
ncbi:hypothetical protein ACFPM0_10110 [Pseudonocardia sulfidoxydans]|uniref:hypothetical protein n=1 Tax=Pseudonocardia sulfidoxydans TaxID=54011 RepID=UPI003617B009